VNRLRLMLVNENVHLQTWREASCAWQGNICNQ
jgi:hypothetical protein